MGVSIKDICGPDRDWVLRETYPKGTPIDPGVFTEVLPESEYRVLRTKGDIDLSVIVGIRYTSNGVRRTVLLDPGYMLTPEKDLGLYDAGEVLRDSVYSEGGV